MLYSLWSTWLAVRMSLLDDFIGAILKLFQAKPIAWFLGWLKGKELHMLVES